MGRIVALGGGEIGRPHENGGNYPVETTAIDKEIIKLTNKKHPKFLFIPTASSDSIGYQKVIKQYFELQLKCEVEVLELINKNYSQEEIKLKILTSDIIYVGDGNTLKMMQLWRKLKIDEYLYEAFQNNIVLCGLSAGSICWFNYGLSDSMKFTSKDSDFNFIKVKGLGIISALHCPHYDIEVNRKEGLKKIMRKTPKIVAIALDNCSALEIVDDKYKIITSKSTAKAYKMYWKNNEFFEEEIERVEEYRNLKELLTK